MERTQSTGLSTLASSRFGTASVATFASRQDCPLYLSDEDDVAISGDATEWLYTCNSVAHGAAPYVWTSAIPRVRISTW